METKDGLKRALIQEAEAGVLKLLAHLQKLPEGDLQGLEQRVMETIFEIGRAWMQSVLSEGAPEEQAPPRRWRKPQPPSVGCSPSRCQHAKR